LPGLHDQKDSVHYQKLISQTKAFIKSSKDRILKDSLKKGKKKGLNCCSTVQAGLPEGSLVIHHPSRINL
ncbi:MAG: hypothetical protein ABFS19_12660, partial [Thermodesulfobacteriota bacterium]